MPGCIQVHHCGSGAWGYHEGRVLVNIGTNLDITDTSLTGEHRTGSIMFLSPDLTLNLLLRQDDMLLRMKRFHCLSWNTIPSI